MPVQPAITFADYIDFALQLANSVNESVDAVVNSIATTGIDSPETREAIQQAKDVLNHRGFHFDQWDALARLLNVML